MRFAVPALAAALALNGPDAFRISVAARSVYPGELVVLTLTAPPDIDVVRVRAFDRDAPVFKEGAGKWVALIGIDLNVAPGRYQASVDAPAQPHEIHSSYAMRVLSHTFPVRRLRVDAAFVNPDADARARIAREAADLEHLWQSSSPPLWTGRFVRPVTEAATGRFGARSIFNGEARPPHTGVDFSSPAGTPIKAPAAGRIVLARSLYFSGNTIVIDHGRGLYSLLAHLSAFDVQEGDAVVPGQIVGRVGATGRVTGPHLHWAVRVAGARVDPLSVLALLGAAER